MNMDFVIDLNSSANLDNLALINNVVTFDKSDICHKLRSCGVGISYTIYYYEEESNGLYERYKNVVFADAVQYICDNCGLVLRLCVKLSLGVNAISDNDVKSFIGDIGEYFDVADFMKVDYRFRKAYVPKRFKWVCSCSDGSFEDSSNKAFDTQRECYEDMRRAVLDKMCWNTEWCDFDGLFGEENDYIDYNVKFRKDGIVHTSYSGVYTYKIIRTD